MLLSFSFADEMALNEFAADLAFALRRGDFVALNGDLGAGKSTLARAIIRTLTEDEELEVPSPTFTLVQQYETARLHVTHADLYRLSQAEEVEELGLLSALEEGVLLVEWPQKGQDILPLPQFLIVIEHAGEGRNLTIETGEEAGNRLTRSLIIRRFLSRHGHCGARRRYLTGDASARRYEKIFFANDQASALLMDAPAMDVAASKAVRDYAQSVHLAQNITQFVGIARLIGAQGFAVPDIVAVDLDEGLLLSNFFDGEGLLDGQGQPIIERYLAAAQLLADFHEIDWPQRKVFADFTLHIPPYGTAVFQRELALLLDWYLPYQGIVSSDGLRQEYHALWATLLDALAQAPKTLIMRDYHSPNLFWREGAAGKQRIGLIDFQDALMGPVSYDLSSLAQDARVTIARELEAAIVATYLQARKARNPDFDEEAFRFFYAITAAQRVSKIMGIFVRLKQRDGKPHYIAHLPRLMSYLMRSLNHPRLSALASFYRAIFPH